MNKPTLVVFDLGGVLIRICRSWPEACAAAGLDNRPGSPEIDASGTRHALAEKHGTGDIEPEAFFAAVSHGLRGIYSPAEVKRIHDAWLLGEYANVDRLIQDIHGAGVGTGILSNTNKPHWDRQFTTEFRAPGLVHHPHASHLLRLLKPNRAIYDEFARRTNYAGRECELLFFDDLEENVAAARDAGWQSEQIDHTGDTAAQMRQILVSRGVLRE